MYNSEIMFWMLNGSRNYLFNCILHITGHPVENGGKRGVCIERDGAWRDISQATANTFICGFYGLCSAVISYII